MRSAARCPQALFLHDVPQLTQVGLGDGVIRFQLKCPEIIGFSFLQLPVEVEDRPQVHQGCRILKFKQRALVVSRLHWFHTQYTSWELKTVFQG